MTRGTGTQLSDQEKRERARDRFVWWTNGVLILLILGVFALDALDSPYMSVIP